MSRPLYQLKAAFSTALGHPARIRVLELLPEVGIESANLAQQSAVLRLAGGSG